jgi:hypothetical protein
VLPPNAQAARHFNLKHKPIFRQPCDFQRPKQSNNNNRTIAQSTVFRDCFRLSKAPAVTNNQSHIAQHVEHLICYLQMLKLLATSISSTSRFFASPAIFKGPSSPTTTTEQSPNRLFAASSFQSNQSLLDSNTSTT